MPSWNRCAKLFSVSGLALTVLQPVSVKGETITQSFTPIAVGTTVNEFVTPTDQWFMPVFHPELPYFKGISESYPGPQVLSTGSDLAFQFSGVATSSSNSYASYPNLTGNLRFFMAFDALANETGTVHFFISNGNQNPSTPDFYYASFRTADGKSLITQTNATPLTGLGEANFVYSNTTSNNEIFVMYIAGGPFSWYAENFSLGAPVAVPSSVFGGLLLMACLTVLQGFRRHKRQTGPPLISFASNE